MRGGRGGRRRGQRRRRRRGQRGQETRARRCGPGGRISHSSKAPVSAYVSMPSSPERATITAIISSLCLGLDRLYSLDTMALVPAPSYRTSSTPARSAAIQAAEYILSIAPLPSYYAAAASAPSNAIHLFDKERLRNVLTLPGHASAITTLRSVSNVAGNISHALLSSGKDGVIHAWDERAGSAALRCEPPSCVLHCDVPTTQSRVRLIFAPVYVPLCHFASAEQ